MTVGEHEVVLWDRIITRGDMKDLRATGQKVKTSGGPKRNRGNVRVEEGKNKYQWRNPGGTFRQALTSATMMKLTLVGMYLMLTSRCITRLCLMLGFCLLEWLRRRRVQSLFQRR
jgi:signal peptidase complex subunit 3